jgi:hypothetical protein
MEGLLVQMMAIEKLVLGGLPKEGRELLDVALAEEETAARTVDGTTALSGQCLEHTRQTSFQLVIEHFPIAHACLTSPSPAIRRSELHPILLESPIPEFQGKLAFADVLLG